MCALSYVNVENAFPAPSSTETISPLGKKTNPKEISEARFSQELPKKLIWRMQMAPVKKRPTTSMRLVNKAAANLENTHMNSRMPPSMHFPAEQRKQRIRLPLLKHGTNYNKKRMMSSLHPGTPQCNLSQSQKLPKRKGFSYLRKTEQPVDPTGLSSSNTVTARQSDMQTLEVKETAPHLSVIKAPSVTKHSAPDAPCAAGQEE